MNTKIALQNIRIPAYITGTVLDLGVVEVKGRVPKEEIDKLLDRFCIGFRTRFQEKEVSQGNKNVN